MMLMLEREVLKFGVTLSSRLQRADRKRSGRLRRAQLRGTVSRSRPPPPVASRHAHFATVAAVSLRRSRCRCLAMMTSAPCGAHTQRAADAAAFFAMSDSQLTPGRRQSSKERRCSCHRFAARFRLSVARYAARRNARKHPPCPRCHASTKNTALYTDDAPSRRSEE